VVARTGQLGHQAAIPWTRRFVFLAPLSIGAAIVISSYSETAGYWSVILRPLCVLALLAMILTAAFWALLRDAETAAVGSSAGVLLLAGHPIGPLIFLVASFLMLLRYVRRMRHRPAGAALSTAILVLSGSYLAVSLTGLGFSGAISSRDFWLVPSTLPEAAATPVKRPNIYVLLLDAYARDDSLASVYRYDNEPFLSSLTSLGFDVYSDSHTEHDATSRTTVSMLSGSVDDLQATADGDDPAVRDQLYREVRRRLAVAPAIADLRAAGYRLIVIQPPVVHVVERGWDVEIDTGQINDFEINLLSRSPLAQMLRDWVLAQQRQRIEQSLDHWRPGAGRHARVVLAHLMAPHPPFVFGTDADQIPSLPCWPKTCPLFASQAATLGLSEEEFGIRFAAQTDATNALVLPAVARVVAEDPQAVVIVMSDHGSRYSDIDVAERHKNLFAARTPERPWLFGPAPTPRDLFRILLAAYGPSE